MPHPFELFDESIARSDLILLVFSGPRDDNTARKISIRPVTIRESVQYQFTEQQGEKTIHRNHPPAAALAEIRLLLTERYRHAALFTARADTVIHVRDKGTFRIKTDPPSKIAADPRHNREKPYLIPPGTPCPFLVELGVMTATGQVRAAKYAKFRQVNRFLELVRDIVPYLPRDRAVSVIDFGCGKSYLTFALHHLLTVVERQSVRILGLDRKASVVRDCARLATKLGCAGLEFREGDLADLAGTEPIDLAVALHACDTATDVALAHAIRRRCTVILAAPCCQHELAPQLQSPELEPLLSHGILRERFAALVTDALRAEVLEQHGYTTQIVEFIDLEHTAKNLLLRAVRRDRTKGRSPEDGRRMRAMLGVNRFTLDALLG